MSTLAPDAQHTGHWAWRRAVRWGAVVLVALVFAGALAAAGSWLGWRDAGPLPTDRQARSIAAEVFPGVRISETDRYDAIAGSRWPELGLLVSGDDEYDSGYLDLTTNRPDLAAVRATLARGGWRILPESGSELVMPGERVDYVTARRDDVELAVYDNSRFGGGIVFQRPEPALSRVLALAGWGSGLLLGAWVALRFTAGSGPRPGRKAARIGGGLLLFSTLAVNGELFFPARAIPPDTPGVLWEPYMTYGLKLLTIVGVLFWLVAAVRRFLPRTSHALGEWTRLLLG